MKKLPLILIGISRFSTDKPCDNCRERPKSVHLTRKLGGHPELRRDLCDVCFPPGMTSDEEAALLRKLFKEARKRLRGEQVH